MLYNYIICLFKDEEAQIYNIDIINNESDTIEKIR